MQTMQFFCPASQRLGKSYEAPSFEKEKGRQPGVSSYYYITQLKGLFIYFFHCLDPKECSCYGHRERGVVLRARWWTNALQILPTLSLQISCSLRFPAAYEEAASFL